ncbi:hypothetical protein L596_010616 [Steinernema carpocapsae]|uniref:Insulin-like domain-containing protein n=1 Tax=Steinernema carpocapsae TaxID=34508 RepID=A0A4U5PJK6_STECR|nr:hypothetical protein L596_010616 [Steinernema carpocapsae]
MIAVFKIALFASLLVLISASHLHRRFFKRLDQTGFGHGKSSRETFYETIEYFKEKEIERPFSRHYARTKMCGHAVLEKLELMCPNSASIAKFDVAPEEITAVLHDCCQPGCSAARIRALFCF